MQTVLTTAPASALVMQPLADVLAAHELTQADLAQGMGLSRAAANRLVKHGLLPARKTRDVRQRLLAWQRRCRHCLNPIKKLAPMGSNPPRPSPRKSHPPRMKPKESLKCY